MKEKKSHVFTVKNDEKVTEIVVILDKSGSMSVIKNDTIGSFNTFLEEQQKLPDKALMTVLLFDDQYEMMYDGVDLQSVEPLTDKTYRPSGTTALYDAIGVAISKAEKRFNCGKCNRVLVAIITDGQENASHEYNKCQILNLINEHKNCDWEFLYLSASPSAFTDSGSIGISPSRTTIFAHTGHGMRGMMASYSANACSYRTSGKVNNYTSRSN
jgi:Mg-chelatase subunit ChlD